MLFKRLLKGAGKVHKDNKGTIMVEFAICGTLFVGIVVGMMVMGLWIYNASQVSQAARLAAYNVSVTNKPAEARDEALRYMNKTLVACSQKVVFVNSNSQAGYGVAEAAMDPLFPGFQKIIDPKGNRTIDGKITIRKEATATREKRFK